MLYFTVIPLHIIEHPNMLQSENTHFFDRNAYTTFAS